MVFDIWTAFDMVGIDISRTEYNQQVNCPFHSGGNEVNKSARVYPETQSLYCWACAKSWDAVAVVAEARGVDYKTAYRQVRAIYGDLRLSKKQFERVDDQFAELIAVAKRLSSLAREALDNDLCSAARGTMTFMEIEGMIDHWTKRFCPHLV